MAGKKCDIIYPVMEFLTEEQALITIRNQMVMERVKAQVNYNVLNIQSISETLPNAETQKAVFQWKTVVDQLTNNIQLVDRMLREKELEKIKEEKKLN